MRIGLVIYGSLDTLSGGFLYDRKLAEHLRAQGDEVEVISLPWRDYAHHLVDNLSGSLLQRLAGLELDLLIQDELNHPSLFWLNRRLRGRVNYPIIAIVHHLRGCEPRPAWQNSFYLWIERNFLETIDAFIFNSQTTREVVASLLGNDRLGVVAYPAGDRLAPKITEHEIIARAHHPGPLKLIFLGNVLPRKGLHIVLDALRQVPKDKWVLRVAGDLLLDGAYGRKIQRLASTPHLEGMVHFLGSLDFNELKVQLRDSHLLVLPSFYEGYGIAYLEGMSFGLPAVGTRAGAAKEIITHGENGFLIDPGDSASLAQCLLEAARNRDLLQKLSLAAHQRYLAHPTWEDTTRRIREFLYTIVSAPKGFQN